MGRNSLLFISKCTGDLNISYAKVYASFYTRMDFTKEMANGIEMANGMSYSTHQALHLLYFNLVLIKQHIRINPDV